MQPPRRPYPTDAPLETSVDGGDAGASTARPGVVDAGMTTKTGDNCASAAGVPADPSTGDKVEGWRAEDEDALHCLCRLPADTARFRTLMTCDLCHNWFHPACVRLKVREIRFVQEKRRVDHRSYYFF